MQRTPDRAWRDEIHAPPTDRIASTRTAPGARKTSPALRAAIWVVADLALIAGIAYAYRDHVFPALQGRPSGGDTGTTTQRAQPAPMTAAPRSNDIAYGVSADGLRPRLQRAETPQNAPAIKTTITPVYESEVHDAGYMCAGERVYRKRLSGGATEILAVPGFQCLPGSAPGTRDKSAPSGRPGAGNDS